MAVGKNLRFFIQIVLYGLFFYLLWWRWQVSQVRFFDVDEFSYLHWAAELVKGERPYVDFFMFFTPGFLWFFAPLIKAYWMSPDVFLAARMVSYVLFLGVLGGLMYLFGQTRGWKWALLPVVILAFLPMPYDKFLEVRPDNLSTLLAIIGVIGQILAIRSGKRSWWVAAGVFYALSLLVFVKTVPFVAAGVVIALLAYAWSKNDKDGNTGFAAFAAGLIVPMMLFFVWTLTLGDMGKVWYSLTKLPFEANSFGNYMIMEPHLFFFPNNSFYGGHGISLGLLLNHALWIIGIITGVYRFFTPFTTAAGDKKTVLVEWLIGGTFLLLVFGYVQFFPLKHAQYLIPIAIFIAYYCADFFIIAGRKMRAIGAIGVIGAIGGVWVLGVVTAQVNSPKLAWTNEIQRAQLNQLIKSVDLNAYVVDMEGRMLFWADGYDICCVPFGSFEGYLTQRPQPLRSVLESKRVPYIFQGDTQRFPTLSSEDQAYIRAQYAPVEGWGEALWKRK